MTTQTFKVKTEFEQVQVFCMWAEKWKGDFFRQPLKKFQNMDLEDVFQWLIDSYHTEEGEIILRPKLYYEMVQREGHALDCDDAFIFMASLLRSVGVAKQKILVCEVAEPEEPEEYVHIFPALQLPDKILWLDNLKGCKFGKLRYARNLVRITKFSEYV